MKELLSRPILFLFIIFGIAACSENEQESVGGEYLDSRQYENFQDDASEEKKQHEQLNQPLGWHLQQFSDCEVSNLSVPFELDYEHIGGLILDASEGCIVEAKSQRLKMFGESTNQNQTIRWVLLERETAYRDQELVAATFQDGELRSFRTVGAFQKNPSEKISSEIRTRREGDGTRIISRTVSNIFYPFEQENTTTVEYRVGESGDISEL